MNQSILINDDMRWDSTLNSVLFTAISAGAIIKCQLTKAYLVKKGMNEQLEPVAILEFCVLMEFDIEEDASQAIEKEQLTDDGVLILG